MNLVPMVLVHGSNGERSYDLYSRLLRDRIVMLSGEIDERVASLVVSQLLFLQAEDPQADIHLYVNSPGGSVVDGLAIVDSMELCSCAVNTYAVGQCVSMGCVILAAGSVGKRYGLPSSRMMLHQVAARTQGPVADMRRSIAEALRLNELLADKLAASTGQSKRKIKGDMDRDFFLSAPEAVRYGLIDQVLSKKLQ
jgi:ATP-dependent Clp protease protease subunit